MVFRFLNYLWPFFNMTHNTPSSYRNTSETNLLVGEWHAFSRTCISKSFLMNDGKYRSFFTLFLLDFLIYMNIVVTGWRIQQSFPLLVLYLFPSVDSFNAQGRQLKLNKDKSKVLYCLEYVLLYRAIRCRHTFACSK